MASYDFSEVIPMAILCVVIGIVRMVFSWIWNVPNEDANDSIKRGSKVQRVDPIDPSNIEVKIAHERLNPFSPKENNYKPNSERANDTKGIQGEKGSNPDPLAAYRPK